MYGGMDPETNNLSSTGYVHIHRVINGRVKFQGWSPAHIMFNSVDIYISTELNMISAGDWPWNKSSIKHKISFRVDPSHIMFNFVDMYISTELDMIRLSFRVDLLHLSCLTLWICFKLCGYVLNSVDMCLTLWVCVYNSVDMCLTLWICV